MLRSPWPRPLPALVRVNGLVVVVHVGLAGVLAAEVNVWDVGMGQRCVVVF